ncbi:LysR substrate-binding domain-containing protein [Pseudoalteromonas sp. G4]|uniref:LysR substrate-binding domain-containing protein n=1 Tax=Pseudoalteromonas sp. G4 TaxID=2992761 RepID=UPI00237E1EE7|nr:LysR substrate-binding domain-containing protein [Pseudoalteromonas sp. G4]MDE3271441.1 LysR substrate-binding domain-containing protein [Pseudoalteromonas sp. G4]
MNIETKWLQDFLILSETRNFSTAAQLRFVTQPAFSRRIQSLEKSLGCQLIDRRTSPLTLTDEGEAFKPTAQSVLHLLNSSAEKLRANSYAQELRIAATHTLALGVFPKILKTLKRQLPNVSAQLQIADADDCTKLLKSNNCDYLLAFHDNELLGKEYERFELLNIRLLPVALSTTLPQWVNNEKMPYLAYQSSIFLGRTVDNALTKEVKAKLDKVASSSMADSLKTMVLQGLGFAWLPDYSIEHELRDGKLTVLETFNEISDLSICLYRLPTNDHTKSVYWQGITQALEFD